MLQVETGDFDGEFTVFGYRDVAGLFADDDADGIRDLTHAQGGSVAQTQLFGDVHVVAHGEDAAYRHYAVVGDDHRAVMQRGVFEKDIFDEAGVDVGIDYVACLLIIGQWHLALEYNQGSCLRLRH